MFLSPIRISAAEEAVSVTTDADMRRRVILDACQHDSPEHQKRLITALYESGHLTDYDVAFLFHRLCLREA